MLREVLRYLLSGDRGDAADTLALGFFLLFYAEVVAAAAWTAGAGGNRFDSGT